MSTSKAITRNDLTSILNDVLPAGSGGGIVDVDDMTSAEVEDFVEDLTPTTSENISAAITDYFTPTAWTNITLGSQCTSKGLNAWRMIGPFVEVRICFSVSAAYTSLTQIASMPEGKRPLASVKIPCQTNAAVHFACEINSAGAIQIYNSASTSAWFYGSVIYYPEN